MQRDGEDWSALLPTSTTIDCYLADMAMDGTHADGIVLSAVALMYDRPVHVYRSPNESSVICGDLLQSCSVKDPICVAHVPVFFGYGNSRSVVETVNFGNRDHYISLTRNSIRLAENIFVFSFKISGRLAHPVISAGLRLSRALGGVSCRPPSKSWTSQRLFDILLSSESKL